MVGRRGVRGPYGIRGGRGGVSTWLGVGVGLGLGLVANPNPNQVVEGEVSTGTDGEQRAESGGAVAAPG